MLPFALSAGTADTSKSCRSRCGTPPRRSAGGPRSKCLPGVPTSSSMTARHRGCAAGPWQCSRPRPASYEPTAGCESSRTPVRGQSPSIPDRPAVAASRIGPFVIGIRDDVGLDRQQLNAVDLLFVTSGTVADGLESFWCGWRLRLGCLAGILLGRRLWEPAHLRATVPSRNAARQGISLESSWDSPSS